MVRTARAGGKRLQRRYFVDPLEPDKALCAACWKANRKNKVSQRQPASQQSCWACEKALWQMTILKVAHESAEEAVRVAEKCEEASNAAFRLAQNVRSEIVIDKIERARLNRLFAADVAAHRKCWQAALKIARRGSLPEENRVFWWRATVTVESKRLNICLGNDLLLHDPTRSDPVDINLLHCTAGALAAAAKWLRSEARESQENLNRNWGKDVEDLAAFHADHGVSSGGLAEGWLAELRGPNREGHAKLFQDTVRQRRQRARSRSVTEGP